MSQSILKVFFETNKIQEYNLKNNSNYNCSIMDSMCCSDIYECSILQDNKIEDAFAVLYDGKFASILKEIIKLLDNNNFIEAINILRKNFYLYTVSYYKSLASLIRLSKNDRQELEKNNSTIKMFKYITDIKYVKRLSLIYENCYDIYVIKSYNNNFVLCDQFIATASNYFNGMFTNISNRDIGVKGSMIFFPVSSKYYFILLDKNMSFEYSFDCINVLNEEQTNKINNIIYNNATEKIVTIRNYDYNFENVNSCGDEICFIGYSEFKSKVYKKKKEIFYSDYEQSIYATFKGLEWVNYLHLGKNEKCFCGSNKKYKKCCFNKIERCKLIMSNIKNKTINDKVLIDNKLGIEHQVKL